MYCMVKPVVRRGVAHRQVLKLARERSIDLIVMGVRGRGEQSSVPSSDRILTLQFAPDVALDVFDPDAAGSESERVGQLPKVL